MAPSLRHPSAFLPIVMSLAGLALLASAVVKLGLPHDAVPHGEATLVRIFQLLMLAQIPIAAFFAIKWLPQAPKEALRILALQAAAWVTAVGAVVWAGA